LIPFSPGLMARRLDALAPWLVLALPVSVAFGRTAIEAVVGLLVAMFLVRSAMRANWHWLTRPWIALALLWWGWVVICSLPGLAQPGVWPRWSLQAVLMVRIPLCAAAVAWVVTARPEVSRRLQGVLAVMVLYVVAQLTIQFTTGANLFGVPMADNGLLTGPFDRPRSGALLTQVFFPLLLPPVLGLLKRGRWGWVAGTVLLATGVAVMLPIGQRMPAVLVGFGLLVAAWLVPVLRRPALIAAAAACVVLIAGLVAFPAAQYRMVGYFSQQLASFPTTHYGLIYTRAAAMAAEHPWHGRGFAGFRTGCVEERYFTPALGGDPADGGGGGICVTHAHHLYLEALTDAGWPGLTLFSAFALAALATLTRGLSANATPLRIGLFIAALLHLWPLAAGHAFTSAYTSAIFALLLGWGIALSPARGRA